MKPTLAMEGTKDTVCVNAPTETQMNPNNDSKKTKYVKFIAVTGVVAAVAAAAVILAVYFGMKMTKETYQAWQTYRMADGKTVDEKINTDNSSVEIDVPDQMKQITVFENKLTVRRFKHPSTGEYGPCFATEMNAMIDPTHQHMFVNNSYSIATRHSEEQTWGFTDEEVPSYRLSQKVRDMCYDTEVYWMKKLEGNIIVKRAECNDTTFDYMCVTGLMQPYETCIVCYEYEICDMMFFHKTVLVRILFSGNCPLRMFVFP